MGEEGGREGRKGREGGKGREGRKGRDGGRESEGKRNGRADRGRREADGGTKAAIEGEGGDTESGRQERVCVGGDGGREGGREGTRGGEPRDEERERSGGTEGRKAGGGKAEGGKERERSWGGLAANFQLLLVYCLLLVPAVQRLWAADPAGRRQVPPREQVGRRAPPGRA